MPPSRSIALIIICCVAATVAARAQAPSAVTVSGTVVDAGSASPLAGAQLTLAPVGSLAVFPPAGPSPAVSSERLAVTDSVGRYDIRGVAAGRYQLLVKRLGYQPTILDVDVTDGVGAAQLSVGLVVVPVRLRQINVRSNSLNLFGSSSAEPRDGVVSPVDAARARQSAFLGTDVRELTAIGALEGGSLGETDIFRALRRMPGVTSVDDNLAELWIRGVRWDQARVSFDGMPIFNPFHAGGRMSGISADGIGAAFLHPGVRPVSLLNQGASLIDIRSRAATDSGFHASGEASFNGLSSVVELGSRSGNAGMTLMARRSFGGWLPFPYFDALNPVGHASHFTEIAQRTDNRFASGGSLEVSLLLSRDIDDFRIGPPVVNGSNIGRLTYSERRWGLRLTQTAGMTLYESSGWVSRYPWGVVDTVTYTTRTESRSAIVHYWTLRGTVSPDDSLSRSRWHAGYDVSFYNAGSSTQASAVRWSDVSVGRYNTGRSFTLGTLWVERRFQPTAQLTIEAGGRFENEIGFRWNADVARVTRRLAPTLQARYRPGETTTFAIGASRTFQDLQELPAAGVSYGPGSGIWLTTASDVRALRADQMNAGVNRWLGQSILLDANVYYRRLSNVALPAFPNGDTLTQTLFAPGRVTTSGIEVSARKLAGRLTGTLGYTLGKATERVGGADFVGSGDRRHSIDAAAMLRLGRFRLGSGATYMTGAPYTRINSGLGYLVGPDSVDWKALPTAERRNAERLPDFLTLDLFGEWRGRIRRAQLTPFIGIRNVTDRQNLTAAYPGFDHEFLGVPKMPDLLLPTSGRKGNLGFRIVF